MWMIGCVCFTLMYFKHPFYNASKVGIISASVIWPDDNIYSDKIKNLVRNLLTPNPILRLTDLQLIELLE